MTYPFTMRRVSEVDWEAVCELARAVFPDDWIPHSPDILQSPPPAGLYVAEQDGRMVGCYHLSLPQPGDAYFSAMRIHPDAQGHGFGTLFCRAQVEHARELGAENIYLLSFHDNARAHKTVQKNGFAKLGDWLIYSDLTVDALGAAAPGTATGADPGLTTRQVEPEDLAALRAFWAAQAEPAMQQVICFRTLPWATMTFREAEWLETPTVVAEGPGGIQGLLMYFFDDEWLIVRRLDGTPEAVRALLTHLASATAARPETRKLEFGLPARSEPLLASLAVPAEHTHRMFCFALL